MIPPILKKKRDDETPHSGPDTRTTVLPVFVEFRLSLARQKVCGIIMWMVKG